MTTAGDYDVVASLGERFFAEPMRAPVPLASPSPLVQIQAAQALPAR